MSKVKKNNYVLVIQIAMVAILAGVLFFGLGGRSSGIALVSASDVIPVGVPTIYGDALGVSYDSVSAANPSLANQVIAKLGNLDREMTLEGTDLDRYVRIATKISCEYCCGAKAIIFSNGQPACGCAHSYAMRGLAKYLIKYHGSEYTDEEILGEMGKWKVLFFPGILESKAKIMQSQGIDTDYVSLTSNQYRGIEKGQATGGMVGGC